MFTQSADGVTTARACVTMTAFALGGLIACETCSCTASGAALAGTAWELTGATATPIAPTTQAQANHPQASQVTAPQRTHAQQQPHAMPADRAAGGKTLQPSPDADPRMMTLARMDKHVTVDWQDISLQDAFAFFKDTTGTDMMVLWIDEDNPTIGLRPDRRISLSATNRGLVDVLEKILERADTRAKGDGSTWQISDTGTLQIGPRERLNKWTRTYAYDVADILQFINDWLDPDDPLLFDFSRPSTNVHRRWANAGFADDRPAEERAEELRQVIVMSCEPKAWFENGGEAASIIYQRGSRAFVVRAPDYVHRAIDGYHPMRPSRTITPARKVRPSPTEPTVPVRTRSGQ